MPPTPEERIGVLETQVQAVQDDVHQIQSDIRELRNDLADRPSWGVAKVIAGLAAIASLAVSALCTLLITLAN